MEHKWEIYTDGSTKANGYAESVGAWAYLVLCDGQEFSRNAKGVPSTTNQRMELQAAISALESLLGYITHQDDVTVYSDSAYLINCRQACWWVNWVKNGWKNSKKEPVANRDLWEQLIPWFGCEWIKWEKVKGHDLNHYNNIVDELAQTAAEKTKAQIKEN